MNAGSVANGFFPTYYDIYIFFQWNPLSMDISGFAVPSDNVDLIELLFLEM